MKRLLLIEDSENDHEIFRQLIGIGKDDIWHIDVAISLDEAQRKMSWQHYDLVVLDLKLPPFQGLEILDAAETFIGNVPIIVWTGTEDPSLIEVVKKRHNVIFVLKKNREIGQILAEFMHCKLGEWKLYCRAAKIKNELSCSKTS